ncbi:MAG: hypothetical protein AB8B85_09210 [Paracoccaceae bacterium]
MIPAFVAAIVAGFIGWRRAAKAGGKTADKLQYAAAHGIPTFLIGVILMTIAAHLGWLD